MIGVSVTPLCNWWRPSLLPVHKKQKIKVSNNNQKTNQTMRNLKKQINQITKIVLLLVLITSTACDNRKEVEEIPVCDYTFTNITAIEDAIINEAQDINFFITKANDYTCKTAYTMRYTVKYNNEVSNNGLFIYNETTQQHNNNFTISPNNFVGSFTALQIGTYQITFIITNGNAEEPIQTNTITLAFTD